MFLINILIQICHCTIVGIDLGCDSIKVAVGSKTTPVHLVKNYYSHESTPNIFSYQDKSHWSFGEAAIDQCRLNPETCIQNQRIPLDNKFYFAGNSLKGYQIAALSLLQILQNVKENEHINDEMKVVIAIPPSMSYREKCYLYNALTIAGIKCVQFITSTYAPIEVYVNEQRYGSKTDSTAVFIDIGHEGVRVSGFEFNDTKIVQKFGLYNDNIGGKSIDNNLMNLIISKYNLNLVSPFNNRFINENNEDTEYLKNKLHLLSEIRKAREQLLVKTKVSFEFQSKVITINRKDVDSCCKEIKDTLNQMIQSLKQNHPNLLKFGSIQFIGGCSRILSLQDYINKLLPNVKKLYSMDAISSVCMGACYVIDNEVQSKIQVHDALVTTEVILKTAGNVYKLFSYNNKENFNPVVRIDNVNRQQIWRIIDENGKDEEFTKFTINVPYGNLQYNTIDVGFTLNYYLMPVPDQPMLIQQFGSQVPLSINYEKIGWEVSPEELEHSKEMISSMMKTHNQNFIVESSSNVIEKYKAFVQNKLKNYGFWNWKKSAFQEICMNIESRYKTCMESKDCNAEKIESILQEFKSLVHNVLNIDDDDNYLIEKNTINHNIKEETKSERDLAIEELFGLIENCKLIGIKYLDIELWINNNLKTASVKELYEHIGILKYRKLNSHKSYNQFY